MNLLTFLLDAATDGAGSAGGTNTTPTGGDLLGGMAMPIIMILMLVAMWWFTSRSQKKRDQEAQNMRDGLQPVFRHLDGVAAIPRKHPRIKEETFVLETTKEKTHIRFLKAAIRSVDVRVADLTAPETKDESAEQPAEEPKKKFSFFDRKKK